MPFAKGTSYHTKKIIRCTICDQFPEKYKNKWPPEGWCWKCYWKKPRKTPRKTLHVPHPTPNGHYLFRMRMVCHCDACNRAREYHGKTLRSDIR